MFMQDLRKAIIGFSGSNSSESNCETNRKSKIDKAIITGNWGCGDFGGDRELKFLI